ncbi:MAG: PilC/PilY family type IV pilus protein [Burkholderiales bacterium]
MRPTTPLRLFGARMLCALVAWTMSFGPITAAYGAATPLADVPIAAKVSAKPNIFYTLDDSGSMQYNFLPDYVTSTAASISLSSITRSGTTATATGGGVTAISVGDWVNIIGATPAVYNGFYQVLTKPSSTQFTYTMASVPGSSASTAAGYSAIQVVTSAAYCRSGNGTTPCTQQPVNISSTGTAISTTSITRPGPISGGGAVTATATGTAANFLPLNTGDTVLIQNSSAGGPPGNSSDPYYGVFVITKTSATTFTYTINAVANTTPLSAAGGRQVVIQGGSTFAAPPLHAADFNRLAYNPAVTYTAPRKADGTPLTNTGTDSNGNYGYNALKWSTPSVDRDPYAAYETAAGVTPMWAATVKDDLGIKVAVPLYCNTDWPILVNEPNGPATALDAGDQNGQYQTTKGAWCRINGTAYDASVTSGAPAAVADYNYPWQSSSGANGPQYFYRQLSNKSLWCDNTSPYWPRSTGTITGCQGGTPIYTGGTTNQQKCNKDSNVCNPTLALRTYNPASCKTDPPAMYCVPGTGGSGSGTPGTGSLPECLACNCVADTPVNSGHCSINTGTVCTGTYGVLGGNAACPDVTTTGTLTGCSGGTPIYAKVGSPSCTTVLWDPYTNANVAAGTTLLADSNAAGVVCRHNNQSYTIAGVPSVGGLFSYPRTNLGDVAPANKAGGTTPFGYPLTQTGAFTTQITGSCPTVGTTVQIPRHYYVVDSIQFCDNRTVTADVQWRGFGAGACQSRNDLARYKEVKYGTFTRVDLFPTNALPFPGNANFAATGSGQYPKGTPANPSYRVWLASSNPGPDNSESINYANWYAYYSTRLLAAKTTSATAFSYLTNVPPDPIAYRVGFHNLGEEPTGYGGNGTPIIWQNVGDWDLAQRTAWYGKLFGVAVNNYKTPTLDAMLRIGNLVETGGAGGLPASINPLPGGATDPFPTNPATGQLVSCTNNYHILFTDGKTNQVTAVTTPGDQDAVVPSTLSFAAGNAIQPVPPDNVLNSLKPLAAANSAWPRPFVQGVAVPNTLSDVAAYYWTRDLRPSLPNNVPASASKGTADLDPSKDVAWWQHVNFSAISFGAEGTLDATQQPATLAALTAGTLSWPDLTQPYNPIYPKGAGAGAVAVDDLWHATVMSRGSFVYARSPIEVAYGLASILAGIQNQRKSRSGAAFSGQVLNYSSNVIFEPTIEPGWAGDLLKVEINPATGAEVQTWWQASLTLAAQIDPVATATAEPWMDPAHRRVVTSTAATGPGIPFQWANLSSAQKLSLAPDATTQKKMVSYLRGGNTWTDTTATPNVTYPIEGTAVGQFRKRFGPLGDLSNAQPVIVTPPKRTYAEGTDPGYPNYVSTKAGRATMVVAPANDGMVHVFDAGPMPTGAPNSITAGGGTELFAYIPKALFKGVAGTAAEDASGIQALTYQDGGVPIYKHHMYVDSSPRVADIDFGGGDWHTIVVGGLGKGGNSYYALDLTSATATNETQAASKFLWEWSDPEVKYSYGRPVIVKVRAVGYPNGRWVVIVTGGYDNASGKGKVFFLDAKTGALLSTVTTSQGTPPGSGQAAGLAQIHAFVHDQSNQIAEQIYGGDLLGNVWRIDVSAADAYLSASAVLFAQLKDPSGNAQPVTVAPQIEIDINNGIDRYVFIGTGRLLDSTDLTSPSPPQTQTMYAIRDGTLSAFSTTGLPIQPRVSMAPVNPDGVSAIATGAPNGWYHDLPNVTGDSERIVVDPQANVNVAAYVGTMVQSDPCLISLPAKLYARDYTTGESLAMSGGTVQAYIDFPDGLIDIATVGMIQSDGSQIVGILGSREGKPGTEPVTLANKFIGQGSRMSWRLLGVQ